MLDERWTRPELPAAVEEALAGRRIEAVGRRGKYLIVRLDDGAALVMHLRMTGNLLLRAGRGGRGRRPDGVRPARRAAPVRVAPRRPPPAGADRARRRLASSGSPTRGASATRSSSPADELDAYFASRLGIEPLGGELTAGGAAASSPPDRRAPLKSFLLNQDRVAGIGNIYADEALFRAQLHPLSPAGSMKLEHCEELREGIVEALEAGLELGGSSIDDYRDARGERGSMQDEFLVHTREGEPCLRCGEDDPADRGRPGARPTSARAASGGCARARAGGEGAARERAGPPPPDGLSDRPLDRRRGASPAARR